MNLFRKQFAIRSSIKESFDNLPSGVCFFAKSGLIVLCNHKMSRIFYDLTGHDIQSIEEMNKLLKMGNDEDGMIRNSSCFLLSDGSTWSFSLKKIKDKEGNVYDEVIASDVSKLKQKQNQLRGANDAKQQTILALRQIQKNVVSITREEEILSMKMQLHNDFGYNLQMIRKYFQDGCPTVEKDEFLKKQWKILHKIQGELDNDDEIDSLNELEQLAAALDMEIYYTGEKPKQKSVRELLSYAVRECLTNTIRHAEGNQVYVEINSDDDNYNVRLTNSGKQPVDNIVEGGGLTSLRTRIENAGGTMEVCGLPKFSITITIPRKGVNVI